LWSGILTFTDLEQAEVVLRDGPLCDLIVSALSVAKTTVYAIALDGRIPGMLSVVVSGITNAGTGTVVVAGSSRNEYDVAVKMRASGVLNEAVFCVICGD
jgi:hypothetical protein